jgi:hypothetical protein
LSDKVKPASHKVNALLLLLVFLLCLQKYCRAAEPNTVFGKPKSSDGYCGIYCLYGAMQLFDVNIDPDELIKPEYIGSVDGSSLAELKQAAGKHGLVAIPVGRLATKDLRRLSLPVIIHTKSSPVSKAYDHYELFLGSEQGKALIYDPPNPIKLVEFWTIAPRWDGNGLLISNRPINLNAIFTSSYLRFAGYAAIAAASVCVVRFGRRRFPGLQPISGKQAILLSFAQCAVLVLASAFIAFAYHFINDEGLLKRPQATKAVQLAYQSKQNSGQKTGETK